MRELAPVHGLFPLGKMHDIEATGRMQLVRTNAGCCQGETLCVEAGTTRTHQVKSQ